MEDHVSSFELDGAQKIAIKEAWPAYNNILLVAGQLDADDALINALVTFFGLITSRLLVI